MLLTPTVGPLRPWSIADSAAPATECDGLSDARVRLPADDSESPDSGGVTDDGGELVELDIISG